MSWDRALLDLEASESCAWVASPVLQCLSLGLLTCVYPVYIISSIISYLLYHY